MAPTTTDADTLDRALTQAVADQQWSMAQQLGAQLDQLCSEPDPPSMREAALWYTNLGLKVFPLQPGTKIPFPGSHGCHDASSDPSQIRTWWSTAPQANIGIATGHLVDVIDIDGPTGVTSWLGDLWDALPPLVAKARTIRDGGHHLYIPAQGTGNRAHFLPGVDYRGRGGYVVAPPSVVDGRRYRWTLAPGAAA